MSDDDFLRVESHDCPMSSCAAPVGSPCRTGKGRVAIGYHTARLRLVPSLATARTVATPALRRPGSVWTELPRPPAPVTEQGTGVRIGYARTSTVRRSLDTQLDSLRAAGVGRIFSETISPRALTCPELDKAVALAREIRASGAAVTLVVHEHQCLGRGIALAALAERLAAADIGLEFLTGALQGSHQPTGMVFTVLTALADMERGHLRDRTLESHESARARGKPIGGATVTDDTMLAEALHLRSNNHSLREIAARLVITTGKKKGRHPSPATVLRLLRDYDQNAATAGPETDHDEKKLATVLDGLPADSRPGPPTVDHSDDLLPSHQAATTPAPATPAPARGGETDSPRAWATRIQRWRTTPGQPHDLVELTRDPESGNWRVTDRDGTHLGLLTREVRVGTSRGRWIARDHHGARLLRGPWKTRDHAVAGLLDHYIDHHTHSRTHRTPTP